METPNSALDAITFSGNLISTLEISCNSDKKLAFSLNSFAASIAVTPCLSTMLAKGGPGPIGAFGRGYGELTKGVLFGKGALVAVLILNAFILTTLDTATRIARYISEELFKINNRFFATFVVVFMSGSLALTGSWKKIWPVFGASNQLVAALTFIVIASWLLSRGKSIKFVFLPGLFMILTAIAALLFQISSSLKNKEFIVVFISAVLAILAVLMVLDVFSAIRRKGLKCKIL